MGEHLRHCARCQLEEHALFAVTPRPQLIIPWHVQQQLRDKVDAEILWAIAERTPQTAEPRRWTRWWRRDTQVSRRTAAGYAAALIAAVAWGGFNWWSLTALEAEVARQEIIAPHDASEKSKIPAAQYQPAAYTPHGDDGYR